MEQPRNRPPQRRRQPSGAPLGTAVRPAGPARPRQPAARPAAGGGRPGGAGPVGKPGGGPRRPGGRPGRRSVPPVLLALRRLPSPRLTGLGAGLFACCAMFVLGCLDQLLLGGSPVAYGLLFLPVSALTALWVRSADLVTAPIAVPIAFVVGVVPIAGGGGFGGRAMAVITALAVHAGWLYGGTLVAGVIASVRKVRQLGRRQRGAVTTGTKGTGTAARAAQR
ncbi:DUF6542 domain-containing protein [Streptomyces sp. NPDC046887]|uniref:DUF6542 domain-containing protein n=1 Tax=Streptomyces sp. NPDC046887 TaxID=3155472 RepID=UPI0033D04C32